MSNTLSTLFLLALFYQICQYVKYFIDYVFLLLYYIKFVRQPMADVSINVLAENCMTAVFSRQQTIKYPFDFLLEFDMEVNIFPFDM